MARPRHCVLLVKAPTYWKPCSAHSNPPAILSAEFYARNVSVAEALAIARAHNWAQLRAGFTGDWMLVVRTPSNRKHRWTDAACMPV